jgi:riboflavin kinase
MLPLRVFRGASNSLLMASSLLFLAAAPKTCAFTGPAVFPRSSTYRYSSALTKRPFLAKPVAISRRMSSNDNGFDQDKFTELQKETSTKIRQSDSEMDHLKHQQRVFDDLSTLFASGDTVPAALIPVYQHLCQKFMSTMQQQRAAQADSQKEEEEPDNIYRILDVATGTGAFFEYYMAAADNAETSTSKMSLHIAGQDLAPAMVKLAKEHAANVLSSHATAGKHEISVVQGDILQYDLDADDSPLFDAIVANAVFGNFWDQTAVLKHLASLLRTGGSLFITHPLGADFVKKLHNEDADTVPHLLPTLEQLNDQILCLPLMVSEFVEEAEIMANNVEHDGVKVHTTVPVYYAAMTRVRDSFLPQIIRLRGNVDTGYGRGGKKLGFPTANLPSRLFQDALKDVPTGVYFGWAVLEDSTGTKKGRNTYQKAVVNVGYSPTFEGQENTEKIVEAHLMIDPGTETESMMEPMDFYGETMLLQLHGFLRPEIKFPNFPALIAQIKADVNDAEAALDLEANMLLQSDGFLADACQSKGAEPSWVGKDGGDTTASWEFQDIKVVLQHLR